jgi:[acyl-carrier-protein] S-malonyltransferase
MKIALLFPGYGSQFVGMGKEFYDEYRVVQEYFEEASSCLDVNFVKLCFASSDVELGKMANAYTSLFLIGSSIYAVLKESGINPEIVLGYNDGESTALFAAGCFSLPDGLYLLNKYCAFYEDFFDNLDMDAWRVSGVITSQLEDMCEKATNDEHKVFVAIYNSPTDHIIAGNRAALSLVQDMVGDVAEVEYLGKEIGLHSSLMNEVVGLFKDYLEKVDFKDLKIPMISSIDGEIITLGTDTKERFIRHINSPLEFFKAIKKLIDYDIILISNQDKFLMELIKHYYPEKMVMTIAKKADIDTLKDIIRVKHIIQDV